MNKKFFSLCILAVLLCLTSASSVAAQGTTTLAIEPATLDVSSLESGETFSLNVTVNDVEGLFGWNIQVNWDPSILNFTDVVEGDFLGTAGDTLFLFAPNMTAVQEGYIQELTCSLLSSNTVNGSGVLVSLEFEVIGSGTSEITLTDTHLLEPSPDVEDSAALNPEISHSVVNGEVTANSYDLLPELPDLNIIIIAALVIVAIIILVVVSKKKGTFTHKMRVRQIAIWAILTAVCVAIQISPRPPNVEFTSLITFLSGYLFGSVFGIAVGSLTMLVNGFLSPWGFGGLCIPFQIIGMALMGLGGGLYRKYSGDLRPSIGTFSVEVAMLAILLTCAYDIITNYGFAIMFEVNFILALIQGIWFAVVHTVNNAILFAAALYPLINIISKVLGEKLWQYKKEPSSSSA